MKKSTLMLICFVLVSINSFSQGIAKKIFSRMEFGIKGGANYSDFTNANFSTDPLVGFHGGFTVAYKFTDHFMIQEEFLFSTQGTKVLDGPLGTQDLKLSYFNVPILLKYRTSFGVYIEGGSQVGIKVKEDVANFNGTDFAKKIDFAAVGGIGYQTKIGLGIGARYVYGLGKLSDLNISNINNDIKNNSIQGSLFFVF